MQSVSVVMCSAPLMLPIIDYVRMGGQTTDFISTAANAISGLKSQVGTKSDKFEK